MATTARLERTPRSTGVSLLPSSELKVVPVVTVFGVELATLVVAEEVLAFSNLFFPGASYGNGGHEGGGGSKAGVGSGFDISSIESDSFDLSSGDGGKKNMTAGGNAGGGGRGVLVEALKMNQALRSPMEEDLVLEEDTGEGAKELY